MPSKEVTRVTEYDESGRIKAFEKVVVEEVAEAAADDTQRAAQLKATRAKLERGEPITKEERRELMADECVRVRNEILGAMKAKRVERDNVVAYTQGSHDAVTEAVERLIVQMIAMSLVHSEKRFALEQRVLQLETKE